MDKRIIAGAAILAVLAGCSSKDAASVGAQPHNAKWVRQGQTLYAEHCASCHGAKLEGQADWRRRKPDGRLPAPPHDESGHTWHHPDSLLFAIVKNGVVPPIAPEGYQSDMPAFGGKLSDQQIWAVLSYIESTWPAEVWQARREMERDSGR
ncbi:MAG: cytochrome c [Sulfuricellaceae bacterium]|jgi:mono/diheme cytochrome c family protein